MADVIHKVGPGQTYTTLAGALTGLKASFEAGTDHFIFHMADFTDTATEVAVAWVGTTETHYLTIMNDPENAGRYRFDGSKTNGPVLTLTSPYTVVKGIDVISASGGILASGSYITLDSVFIDCSTTTNSAFHALYNLATTDYYKYINCLVIGDIRPYRTIDGTGIIYNCLADANGVWSSAFDAIVSTGTIKPTVINCVGINSNTSDFLVAAIGDASDYLSSEDTSASSVATNSTTGVSLATGVDFTDISTGDYTPVVGGKLDGSIAGQEGTDLSADPAYPFDYDITGATRG